MPNSETLNVSCAPASVRLSATFTTGMTGKNKCTASGVISETSASDSAKMRPGAR
jgi:hypothetical protein